MVKRKNTTGQTTSIKHIHLLSSTNKTDHHCITEILWTWC